MVLELVSLASALLKVLIDAQRLRSAKSEWVGNTLAWIIYERHVMLDAVNRARLEQGRSIITEEDVIQVERSALGHCDYSRKFALYCAELALQD